MAGNELAARLPVVLLGIPVVLVLVYLGGWVLGVLIAAVAAVGTREFYGLASRTGARPFVGLGILATVALVAAATESPVLGTFAVRGFVVLLVLTVLSLAVSVWRRWPDGTPVSSASSTVTGAAYVGTAMAFAPLLRHMPGPDGGPPTAWAGTALLFFPIAVTWVGDSCAYLGGRAWGKRKLIPAVSPGKTVAGSTASIVGSMAGAAFYAAAFLAQRPITASFLALASLMGVLLSGAAQVGDLMVSVAKREAGVKDSGRLFPGHGGALDRLDALLLTLPLAYVMLRLSGWAS